MLYDMDNLLFPSQIWGFGLVTSSRLITINFFQSFVLIYEPNPFLPNQFYKEIQSPT